MLDSKPELQSTIENLKKDVETRASDLEAEVKRLREDRKSEGALRSSPAGLRRWAASEGTATSAASSRQARANPAARPIDPPRSQFPPSRILPQDYLIP